MAPSPFAELDEIRHVLQPHYPALRAIPSRAKLLRSPLYASIAPQLTPLLTAVKAAEINSATGMLTFRSSIAQDLAEGHVEAAAEYLRNMVALADDAMDHLQQAMETS